MKATKEAVTRYNQSAMRRRTNMQKNAKSDEAKKLNTTSTTYRTHFNATHT